MLAINATLPANMQRRRLLQVGLGAAAVLALGGAAVALVRPGLVRDRLSPVGRDVFAAVAGAVLEGSLPVEQVEKERAIHRLLDRIDQTLAGLTPPVRDELSTLLALLGTAPGRVGLAGLSADWTEASTAQMKTALQAMRVSSLAVRQQVYLALRELINASYFSDPATWGQMGYPGPLVV